MADPVGAAIKRIDEVRQGPCRNCGLRYGSCSHTSEANQALALASSVLRVVDAEHRPQHTVLGVRCGSCQGAPWPCPTRHGIVKALR